MALFDRLRSYIRSQQESGQPVPPELVAELNRADGFRETVENDIAAEEAPTRFLDRFNRDEEGTVELFNALPEGERRETTARLLHDLYGRLHAHDSLFARLQTRFRDRFPERND